jgi:parallel beta-helix repeat protein
MNYTGAPNNASPLSGFACVKITASNVVFDCNGYNITNDGTADASAILLNGSLTNVTVRNCPALSGYSYGVNVYNSNNSIITNTTAYNDSLYGFFIQSSSGITLSNDSARNNSYGIYVVNSSSGNFTGNNVTNNSNTGLRFDSASTGTNLTNNSVCFNGMDLNNGGTANNGTIDRCDSFLNWNENGHYGCEFACTSMWHRFFGKANITAILSDNTSASALVYNWGGGALNVYFADYDSNIDWQQLQAIGRNTTNGTSSNDFLELDTAFNTSGFRDNITFTYSTEGTTPIATDNYTVYGKPVNFVPVANSSPYNATFKTGILWDMSDGGTEYSNAFNQSTVWVVKANASAGDTYGTYDYLGQIPYTLATYQPGTNVVAIYVEIK